MSFQNILKQPIRSFRYWALRHTLDDSVPKSKDEVCKIKPGYRHRIDNDFFDATVSSELWQREVYQKAQKIYSDLATSGKVVDIGCGSAKKLIEYFGDRPTLGLDLEPTIAKLRNEYPQKEWGICDLQNDPGLTATVVICADMIEHVPDSDAVMNYLNRIAFERLIISTPERKLLYGFNHMGPPVNPAHVREWSFREFREYIEQWFFVDDHYISNERQCTQTAICRKRI